MKLKPWYDVIKPREDLREGKALDAAEFAVHLDNVRDGSGRPDYIDPKLFFNKTYMSENLLDLASQAVRRMSGETSHTSPVFHLATNFGGGKTHALALLYHLAKNGPASHDWLGVGQIKARAGVGAIPQAPVAVFVGTEFDSLSGRGEPGEPKRMTPWGEIAWQLGGKKAFDLVKEHDEKRIAPGGDVIRKMLPDKAPCLILMDEVMNYVSRFRSMGLNNQFYDFLFALTNSLSPKAVLVVAVPASEMEMSADDISDYQRITKCLERLGKAMTITAGAETSEIIRRRLFEWDIENIGGNGKVLLNRQASETCAAYAKWVQDNSRQLAGSIPPEHAKTYFEACYPFHPCVLSVFERKWQSVPKFQQTRGVLRMLAAWVSNAYTQGYKKAHYDPLISLGSAPLADSIFRAAVFEQLGNRALETAVTVDIAGRSESHAQTLDQEATDAIRKERLHSKVVTTVFFESNGGTTRSEASTPEIRLAVGHQDLDMGNIEIALDALTEKCYYLVVERKNYKFSLRENLNKRFVDKRANIKNERIDEAVKQEIQKIFLQKDGVERVFFPEKSIQISDRPLITFVICGLDKTLEQKAETLAYIEQMTKESGNSSRTFKSSVIWIVADTQVQMSDEARKLLAWQSIEDELDESALDDTQKRQLQESIARAKRDLKESVWRAFHSVYLLDKENKMREIPLGLVHSSAASSPVENIVNTLMGLGEFDKGISPRKVLSNWSNAFVEWPTKNIKDALYASPSFPRIIRGQEALQESIARGVTEGLFAYVGKGPNGTYLPFHFRESISAGDVELSDDVFIIQAGVAEKYKAMIAHPTTMVQVKVIEAKQPSATPLTVDTPMDQQLFIQPELHTNPIGFKWHGEVPPAKWMNFYTKVVSRFVNGGNIKLNVSFEVEPNTLVSSQKLEEAKSALKELGLDSE